MTRPPRFLSSATNASTSTTSSTVAQPPEAVAVESDLVVILAALLCALICVLGLIAVARCAWLRSTTTSSSYNSRRNKGIKKKILESLPKSTYDSTNCEKFSTDCAICLTEYVDGDEIRVLPHCGHEFHLNCIDTWLASHSSCPSCRKILVIARCRKCGEFPSSTIAGTSVPMESQNKVREYGSSSTSGFLP